ncbi:MAG: beta-lactamase family protein [Actinobacteria bacterium]|nr:beta-lactamase family protein [Actinomycetota bacterium]
MAESVGESIGRALRKVRGVTVGVLDGGVASFTAGGDLDRAADPGALCWEIGSITKVFTGVLLAEMAGRGEVALDDPVGRHAPAGAAARLPGEAHQPTLRHLATHTSGLPRLPLRMVRAAGRSDDPYAGLSADDVWAHLGPATRLPRRPRHSYSNYGVGLLGHLLERAAGMPYPDLLAERVLDPLGLTATGCDDCRGGGPVVGGFRRRRETPPWTFGALEAAGALRSTPADMLRFAAACLDAPAGPLGGALEASFGPHHRGRLQRVGLGWQHRVVPPRGGRRPALWHNGGTYGTASFLAIDRERQRAVVAFGNRGPVLASPIDRLGWAVFDGLEG